MTYWITLAFRIAAAVNKLLGITKWIAESQLRQDLTKPILTLLIALAAWIWPLAILIIIIAQVTYALTKMQNQNTDNDPKPPAHKFRVVALVLCCLGIGAALGCDTSSIEYRALAAPKAETPSINPPPSIRVRNWLGGPSGREGSCAHASTVNMLHWLNEFDLARTWRSKYSGGEYASRLRQRLDAEGVKYAYTEQANLALLDYAHETRRGAVIWWKPSHACTFCGWVEINGRTYAVVLDNNFPERFEYTEKNQFHRLWASYGGFGLTVLADPPSPPPFRSYEPVTLF
jgi:hypothetical protein